MRKLLSVLFVLAIAAMTLSAQEPGGRGRGPQAPPKNLKVLTPETLMPNMRLAVAGLGVTCNDCHVPTDRSSDEKPMKLTARMMFQMVNDINSKFPDGKAHVTCYTCHRGAEMPLTAPPAAQ
ncbi:MAG TPA: photosynthetic reaction center cytochrome c subunit family protein [Bryobacteraceae bacterium]|jgi:hypothetical protein